MNTITKDELIEEIKKYPTLLQQFMVLLSVQETTLDDIQDILNTAQEAYTYSLEATQKSTTANEKSDASVAVAEKINSLSTKINDEINRAVVEELKLQSSINKEKEERQQEDEKLQANITSETNDRITNDNALQEKISAKQDKLTAGTNIKIEDNVISEKYGTRLLYKHNIVINTLNAVSKNIIIISDNNYTFTNLTEHFLTKYNIVSVYELNYNSTSEVNEYKTVTIGIVQNNLNIVDIYDTQGNTTRCYSKIISDTVTEI